MKWFPTILVLAAFGVLIWVSSKKPATPETAKTETTATDHAAPQGEAPAHRAGVETPAAGHGAEAAPAPPPAVAGGAAKSAAAPAAPARKPDSIVGQVVDAAGAGKSGMQVILRGVGGKEAATAQTDVEGRFVFADVAPGTWWLSAFDPDFLYTTGTTEKVTLDKGRVAEAKVNVRRGTAGIRGVVADAGGKPVADRRITLTAGGAALSVTTDVKGAYQVNGLAEGDWKVTPQDYPELVATVRPRDGVTAQHDFTLTPKAELLVTIVGNLLYPARFSGGEKALLRPPGDADASRWHRRGLEVRPAPGQDENGGHGGHGEHGEVLFANVAPGDWELDVVDATGRTSLLTGREGFGAPIPVKLVGGERRTWSLPTAAAARGAGVEVPFWAIALMFTAIALLIFVTPVLFPPPLVAKPPPARATAA